MQEAGMISAYADLLAGKLLFNPSLSRRVRQEIQDHLWEATAASPPGNEREAIQRAIANFGDPHAIAGQFATLWLVRQMWKVGVIVILHRPPQATPNRGARRRNLRLLDEARHQGGIGHVGDTAQIHGLERQ